MGLLGLWGFEDPGLGVERPGAWLKGRALVLPGFSAGAFIEVAGLERGGAVRWSAMAAPLGKAAV